MDLGECKKKGLIRKTKVDTNLVNSLIEMSDIKSRTVEQTVLDNLTINAFLPMAYDSLREILEAFSILEGFKVLNHDCLGKLLKNLYYGFDLIEFDRVRYIRNSINYYGDKVDLEEGQEIIKKIFIIREDVLKEVRKKLK
jgi:hypothetical protein